MKRIITTLLCLAASIAHADEWISVAQTLDEKTTYELKAGSGEFVVYGNEKRPAYRAIGRTKTKGDGTTPFSLFVIEKRDCEAGFGSLHRYNLAREWKNSFDWADKNTIAGLIANAMCEAMDAEAKLQSRADTGT